MVEGPVLVGVSGVVGVALSILGGGEEAAIEMSES